MNQFRVTLTLDDGIVAVGDKVKLKKDPGNKFDNEAIEVIVDGAAQGYVANHYKTRRANTVSAGRLLDKIPGDEIEAEIVEADKGLYPIAVVKIKAAK